MAKSCINTKKVNCAFKTLFTIYVTIAASLQLTSLTLHHKTEHLRECRNILQKLILVRQYPVKSDFNEMKYSLGWKELQNFIEFSECLKLYDEVQSALIHHA